MIFLCFSFGLYCALFTKDVQASLQGMFFLIPFLDLYFLDNMLGVPKGALIMMIFIALLMFLLNIISTFLPDSCL